MRDQQDDFFKIDPNALDREWLRQSKLYYRYAMMLAHAREESERARAAEDVAYAEVEKDVRTRPESYGLEKVTESAIKAEVLLSDKYRDAQKTYIDARHGTDICQVAVDALDHKKKALENLVQLRLADYYSEPRVRSDQNADEFHKRRARTAGRERSR